jgi:uncharacterized membrane protein
MNTAFLFSTPVLIGAGVVLALVVASVVMTPGGPRRNTAPTIAVWIVVPLILAVCGVGAWIVFRLVTGMNAGF